MKKLFDYLNNWGRCHVSHNPEHARSAYELVKPLVNALDSTSLTDDLHGLKVVNGEAFSALNLVHLLFDTIRHEWPRFGAVPASKLLHIRNPKLCVPWDAAIYGEFRRLRAPRLLKGTCLPDGYVYAKYFLTAMQKEATEAIKDYAKEHECSDAEAIDALEKRTGKSIAKLIDQVNWLRE